MNRQRREKLKEVLTMLSAASTIVEHVCDVEQDCMDNYPENLQNTDRFERMEEVVDSLNDAIEKIGEVEDHIRSAIA